MNSFGKDVEKVLKFEPYVLGLFCIAMILHLSHLNFSQPLLVISASTLSQFNLFKALRKQENLTWLQRSIRIALVLTTSIGFISLLFLLLNWPGKFGMMIIFLFLILALGLIIAAKQIETTKLLPKVDLLVLIGLFILILSGNFNLI
jgi:hypothetical protein